jgi:hypothetical protein
MVADAWKEPNPKKHHTHLTSKQEAAVKKWASHNHIKYPSLVANMHACQMKKKNKNHK